MRTIISVELSEYSIHRYGFWVAAMARLYERLATVATRRWNSGAQQ